MLKYGKISESDPDKARARVTFDDEEIVSDWLPILVQKAKSDSYFYAPEVGEHVVCFMDGQNENGVILGAIYSEKTLPKVAGKDIAAVEFSDGTTVKYDKAAQEFTISTLGSVKIEAAQAVDITSLLTTINGPVTVNGPLTAAAGLLLGGSIAPATAGVPMSLDGAVQVTGDVTGTGEISTTGNISTTGEIVGSEVRAGLIALKLHKHTAAGSPTTPAIP